MRGFGGPSAFRLKIDPLVALEARKESIKAGQILKAALEDPYLADVVITGLLTIYQPPQSERETEENSSESASDAPEPGSGSQPDAAPDQTQIEANESEQSPGNSPETENAIPAPPTPEASTPETDAQTENPAGEDPALNLPAETESPSPAPASSQPVPGPENSVTVPPVESPE